MRVHSIFLLASLTVACGDDKNSSLSDEMLPGKSGFDGSGANGGADTGDYDTPLDIDGEPFEPDTVEAFYYPDDGPLWMLTAKEGSTWLSVENYADFGGATEPGTRRLGTAEVSYATCGVCLILKTGCSAHGDHAHCSATYMPEPGSTITFDELDSADGGTWAGSISPIRFVEVTISGSALETTPVEGGDQIELDTWSFDVTLREG